MRRSPPERLVAQYLDELRAAANVLSRSDRDELVASLEEHIAQALPAGATEAQIRNELDRLGTPQEIASAAAGRPALAGHRGPAEWGAIVLLPLGAVVLPLVGWVAGVVLLWRSRAWTVRDKLIGTFCLPGGIALAPLFLIVTAGGFSCGGQSAPCGRGAPSPLSELALTALLVILIGAPVVSAAYLAWRAGRRDNNNLI